MRCRLFVAPCAPDFVIFLARWRLLTAIVMDVCCLVVLFGARLSKGGSGLEAVTPSLDQALNPASLWKCQLLGPVPDAQEQTHSHNSRADIVLLSYVRGVLRCVVYVM
jgi:hypothetical protein